MTIQSGAGDDTIEGSNFGEIYLFASNTGNNVVTNFGENDTLKCTAGKIQSLVTVGNDVVVSLKGSSYSGTVTLQNAAGHKFIQKDNVLTVNNITTIESGKDKQKLIGTSGRDLIVNSHEGVTIQSGAGDDTIEGSNFGEMYLFASNTGDNVIVDFGREDSIRCTAGSIKSIATVGNDVLVSMKGSTASGTVRLIDAAGLNFVQNGKYITVDGGVNRINNSADATKVVGTDGADYIVNSGQYVSIDGNDGNDTIESSDFGETFLFDAVDGDDVILGFDSLDALRIMTGAVQSASASGSDYVVKVADGASVGSVTLKDVGSSVRRKGDCFILDGGANKMISRADDVSFLGTELNDSIVNTGERVTIAAGAGNDTLVGSNYGELYQFGSADGYDLITNFGANDSLQLTSGSFDNSIRTGNDVIINVRSALYSGAITLGGAGAYDLKQDGDFIIAEMHNYVVNRTDKKKIAGTNNADYITNSGRGVSIQSGAGNDTIEGSNFGEMYLFSSADGNNVITNFGVNDTLQMTSGKTMAFATVGSDVVVTLTGSKYKSTVRLVDAAGMKLNRSGKVLYVDGVNPILNTSDREKVVGTAKADYIVSTGERVTIASGAGNDTVTGSDLYGEMYLFASNTGNNVITNFGENDTLKCTAGSIKSVKTIGNDVVVSMKGSTSSGTVTLVDAAGLKLEQSGKVLTVNGVSTIENAFDDLKVIGTDGADWITNSGERVTLEGKGGNDTLEGSVFGEVFAFSSADGDNVVRGFGREDSLRMTSGKTLTYSTVGADIVVTVKGAKYSGTVTLENAAGLELKQSGKTLYVDSVNEIVNREDSVKITGTSGADYIVNTGERVTISSGGGSDTLVGSDAYGELFAFSSADGDNVIVNFSVGDTLKMSSGKSLTYSTVGSDVVVSLKGAKYTGTITLLDAADYSFKKSGSVLTVQSVGSSAELPSDDYWFEQETAFDPIGEIMSVDSDCSTSEFLLTGKTHSDTLNATLNDGVLTCRKKTLTSSNNY